MSEREQITVSARALFWTLAIGCVGCLYFGSFLGEMRGQLRMKHWQDEWYAAHPVVKEVTTFAAQPIPMCRKGEYFTYKASDNTFTCTPPPPKPKKESKRHITHWEGGPTEGSITLPAENHCKKLEGMGFICDFDYPTQPIPEKEPAPKRKCADGQILYAVPCGPQPDLNQPIQPWDCGDGKPTTAPCPAASQTAEKPQP